MDRTLRDISDCQHLMGEVPVLLSRANAVKACIKSLPLWQQVKIFPFKTNMKSELLGDEIFKGHSSSAIG